ncbi:GH1 family beta-glucosidase [Flavicella marina]|uniref:GH1 family beta-glucosidase n=1 Tax=Flavicella marina TaxID=1475951 RepID=UPI0012647CD2|nr:GH1 family beta-glucosidase [Flavicella marina]
MAKKKIKKAEFPEDFIWGVAAAAYQNEGAFDSDGKGPSIWDTFTNKRNFQEGNANVSTDFYHKYEEDILRIKEMNLDSFRFSLSWSRIFPNGVGKPNPEGVAFYHKVIDFCLLHKITPWVTLYHWDLPQALEDKGGWTCRSILDWFSYYTDFCTKEFGEKVSNWMVLNEPMSFVGLGYFLGEHAPGKKGMKNFLAAAHHAVLCQAIGGRIVRENVLGAYIGTTFSCSYVAPKNLSYRNIRAAKRIDALLNRFFLEPLLGLGYPFDAFKGLKKIKKHFKPGDEKLMQFEFDFIGIQYYFKVVAEYSLFPPILFAKEVPASKRNVKMNSMGMEIYHKGLYKILKKFNKYKKLPALLITEVGVCLNDELIDGEVQDVKRIKYLKKSLLQIRKALKKGIDVQGVFFWTLVDNFEWAEGYKPRFGLLHNDLQTQKRTLKKSAYWLQSFLKK